MNKIFNKLSFGAKLGIIGIVPLIFLLYASFQFHREKLERISVVESFSLRIAETSALTKLIDHLQTERRHSHAYVLSGQSKDQMMQARQQSEEAYSEVEKTATRNLKNFAAISLYDQMILLRQRIDADEASPEEVMDLATKVVLRINILSIISTQNIPYLEELNADLRGQRLLSQMVTYLGILRGTVYQALYEKKADLLMVNELKNNLIYFRSIEKEFFEKVAPQDLLAYQQISKTKNVSEMLDLVEKTSKNPEIFQNYKLSDWWVISTNAVDNLKLLQRQMLNRVEVRTLEVIEQERRAKNMNLLVLLINISIVITILLFVTKNIAGILNNLKDYAELIALGKSGNIVLENNNDAIGLLANSIRSIDKNNAALADAANHIGKGNFNVLVQPRSDEDILGNAVLAMKTDLSHYSSENERKIWIQNGISQLNDAIRGEKTVNDLCDDALRVLTSYIGAHAAVFYTADNSRLLYAAGYAVSNQDKIPATLRFGESLAGQAAKEQRVMVVKDLPRNYFNIVSASGETAAGQVMIVPLIHNDVVEGVIEFASLQETKADSLALINEAIPALAISLQVARNRAKLKELFEETQAQSEELQAQHSELENLNSELEMQTQKLQASEEELRVQQEELQQTNQELEERSALLEEKNMEVKRKAEELELSSKYKSEFLANVSHELRTPLNSILLLSRLLHENNDKNLNEEQIEYAKVIQGSGSGLLALIDEILDLSKIEAGKMDVELLNVGLGELKADMDALFKAVAKEKNVEFRITEGPDLPSGLLTDKTKLEQILKNLLSNALKFTSHGYVELNISRHPQQKNFLRFTVKDTGIGIPKEKQPLVFEAFQQADGSTKRKYGGTGLGLSISRELARLLGGEISLVSEIGKGSEFTFSVPVSPVEVRKETNPTDGGKEEETEQIPQALNRYISATVPENIPDDRNEIGAGDKIMLIIEDDTRFAKALLDVTRKKGYRGVVAVRGDEGVALAQQLLPAGILLDVQLPVKSGLEVMEELKANPRTRHIPVHMMSSFSLKNETMLKGAVNFIDKPMAFEQMNEIFSKIEYVLERKTKKVLIVEDNPKHAKALAYFLGTFNINSELKNSIGEGVDALNSKEVDCVILDMGIPDAKAYETLEEAKKNPGMENLPIIVFTGKSLSKNEELRIRKYADSIIVKTANSYQRMLDEVSLFLHLMEDSKHKSPGDSTKKLGAMNDVLEGKVILVADDDVRNIYSLSKALEKYKVTVITAVDGKEALLRLKENNNIDLVLMDMMMPEMDGYESTRKIRENARWRNLPVIAVTAKAMSGDREKCISAGASDYITKPVDIDQLVSLLRVWLYEKN